MCGIVAIKGITEYNLGKRMLDRMIHRGPDEEGIQSFDDVWLGHRRLSIVDLENGKQPLSNEADDIWMVANGEIYNHATLRQGLKHHNFKTDSDNEVILHLLEEKGPEAIEELQGMFAFVAADSNGHFIAARDPLGIKPLYIAQKGAAIIFSSEIKAFDEAWQPYIKTFPPGHYWTDKDGFVAFSQTLSHLETKEPSFEKDPNQIAKELRQKLFQSVEKRMMSDVPVGVFLSGGLDSSVIAAIANQLAQKEGKRIQSFAVGTENSSDINAARQVAHYLGTEHYEYVYTPEEALAIVPEVIEIMESFDPSLVQSAVANYMIAKLTSQRVKVVLTGEGADELFAGYEYYKEITDPGKLRKELVTALKELHHLNLQRCDRTTMAHSLEARVPFLDTSVIEYAFSIPVGMKIHGPEQTEKWILRKAFENDLPDDILWRKKVQFNDGTGMTTLLRKEFMEKISAEEFKENRYVLSPPIDSRDEMAYFRYFNKNYNKVSLGAVTGRSPSIFATQ